jgi:FAD dependent oxidoreductase TIGR03364
MMTQKYDVAVVGAGIVGLAHAWRAASQGLKVIVLERTAASQGASIRNFGMVWPIGQPAGELHQLAMRSRELWLELSREANIWCNPCGSLHLAHRADELAVLQEFTDLHRDGELQVELLTPSEVLKLSPAANPTGLLCGMWSPTECCVNPPRAMAALAAWLAQQHQVCCQFGTAVTAINDRRLICGDGQCIEAERIMICSGYDFQTLLPEVFAAEPLRICKLHMFKTVAQATGWRLGPHLASGLTLRHYTAFASCPSLAQLQQRVQEETPELDRFGIHVMASQNDAGEVILGDSHEYDAEISPFDRAEIDELILRELRKQFVFPDWTIHSRWHGIYAKHSQRVMLECEPLPQVHVCVAPGGAGMTMSLGIADRFWSNQKAATATASGISAATH